MKKIIFLLILFLPLAIFAQYVRNGEEVVISFKTKDGKNLFVVKAKDNSYIQYRFGTAKKFELEFPKQRDASSWKKFQYNHYVRGGGIQNAGMDIGNLSFENEGVKYVVYKSYFAEDDEEDAGIKLYLKDGLKKSIRADIATVKGCICDLEETGKIEITDGMDFYEK